MARYSYAVPREVGKVGTESPTFIEPVQKRKDGIEAMFTRQTKAAQAQQRSDTKRKRESVSPAKDEEEEKKKEMGTSAPVSAVVPSRPAKRSKEAKGHPIKSDDKAAADSEEGSSDVEILLSGPSSSSLQAQSVGPSPLLTHEMTHRINGFFCKLRSDRIIFLRRLSSQGRRKRKVASPLPPRHRVRSRSGNSSRR